jgi:RNA polymerase sigma-70 factor (ECF subfamily)
MLFARKPTTADFEAVALPYLDDLYRTASRVLGDASRADDVLQDVYLQAWKSFAKFEPGTNCKAWLYRILFHTLQSHRRKWFSWRAAADSEEILEQTAAQESPVSTQITDGDLLQALTEIPREFREVVLLIDVEEFSYKEAAGILGTPAGTVMSRLSRGRRALRERLGKLAQSYGIARERAEGQEV